MKRLWSVIGVCALVFGMSGMADAGEIKFGVQNVRGADKAKAQWDALGKYLSGATGETVNIVPVKPEGTVDAVKDGSADYMLCNPVVAVQLAETLGAKPVASLNGMQGAQFAGVIFSKKGSGIAKAEDLKGKKVMGYQFGAGAGAYVFQVYYLKKLGIDAHKDFAAFTEAKKQDDIVLAVKAGVVDAGFVRTGVLENMAKEGKVSLDDFEIVDPKNDDLKLLHTTKPYPDFLVMASSKVDAAVVAKVEAALIKLGADDEAAKNGKIKGFVAPLSLDDMKAALKELKLAPYDK